MWYDVAAVISRPASAWAGFFAFWGLCGLGRKGQRVEGLIVGLIWLLIYALIVAVVCWIVTRLLAQFFPPAAPFTWVVWAIGGLILLLLLVKLLVPALPA